MEPQGMIGFVKLGQYLMKFVTKARDFIILDKNFCVDKTMVKFKGRSSIKQYHPLKPIKQGYKI